MDSLPKSSYGRFSIPAFSPMNLLISSLLPKFMNDAR